MLELRDVEAFYGPSHILKRLSLSVPEGAVVALLGRNGAGKSTTLKSVMGLVAPRGGEIRLRGERIDGLPSHAISKRGIAYVPEERRVFSNLTVSEHLRIAQRAGSAWTAASVEALFPSLARLRDRRARFLSGGEQQMLAIGRALVTGPTLLLLDEPSQGLAPVIVDAVVGSLEAMKARGLSILLVEQDLEVALHLADRAHMIEDGQLVFSGTAAQLRERTDLQSRYLSVG